MKLRSGRDARALLALVLATVGSGVGAGQATAAPGMEIALQDDYVFVEQYYYGREAALVQARQLGVSRLRVNVRWASVVRKANARKAPRKPRYMWSKFDSLVSDAARHGIKLQVAFTGPAPRWATGNRKIGNRAVDPKRFGRFVRDAAKHFKGRVDRYSIWNEPNWHTQLEPANNCRKNDWNDGCDSKLGELYRKLYVAGYRSIKAVDRRAEVLFGEFAPQASGTRREPKAWASSPLAILREITCSKRNWKRAGKCPKLRADGFAHHPYAFSSAPDKAVGGRDDVTLATLNRLTSAIDKLARRGALRTPNGSKMELYLTEYGYHVAGKRKLSDTRRTAYLTKSFDMALAHPRVRQMLQYLLVGGPPRRDLFPTQLINHDGSPTGSFAPMVEWATLNAPNIAAAAAN